MTEEEMRMDKESVHQILNTNFQKLCAKIVLKTTNDSMQQDAEV
jgi:hypothetical protein